MHMYSKYRVTSLILSYKMFKYATLKHFCDLLNDNSKPYLYKMLGTVIKSKIRDIYQDLRNSIIAVLWDSIKYYIEGLIDLMIDLLRLIVCVMYILRAFTSLTIACILNKKGNNHDNK